MQIINVLLPIKKDVLSNTQQAHPVFIQHQLEYTTKTTEFHSCLKFMSDTSNSIKFPNSIMTWIHYVNNQLLFYNSITTLNKTHPFFTLYNCTYCFLPMLKTIQKITILDNFEYGILDVLNKKLKLAGFNKKYNKNSTLLEMQSIGTKQCEQLNKYILPFINTILSDENPIKTTKGLLSSIK